MTAKPDDFPSDRVVAVRIGLLVVAHLLVGLADTAVEYNALDVNPVVAFTLAISFLVQPGVIAIGVVLPVGNRASRAGLAVVGMLLCVSLFLLTDWERNQFVILTFLMLASFALAAIAAGLVRLSGYSLQQTAFVERSHAPWQFSIAQLLLLTTVAAFGVDMVQFLKILGNESEWNKISWLIDLIPFDYGLFVFMVIITYGLYLICLTAIQMLAVWAAFGRRHLFLQLLAAVGGMALTGLFPAAYFHDELPWNWLGIALLAGIDPLCTFLVVRSCGYRLVRTPRSLPSSNYVFVNTATDPHSDLA